MSVAPSIRRILVPFDGGAGAETAVMHAAELARSNHATVDLCALVHTRRALICLAMLGGLAYLPEEIERQQADEAMKAMRTIIAKLPHDLGIRSFVRTGPSSRVIDELVGQNDYDLVVVAATPSRKRRRSPTRRRRRPAAGVLVEAPAALSS